MKQALGILSRADLVGLNQAEAVLVAKQLGLELMAEPMSAPEIISDTTETSLVDEPQYGVDQSIDQSAQLNPWFWYLAKRDWHDEDEQAKPESVPRMEAWRNRPPEAQHSPLYSPQALSKHLLPHLVQIQHSRNTDWQQVVKTLSRAEPLHYLPRETRHSPSAPLVIVVDRRRHLIPYWQDQTLLIQMLMQGGYQAQQIAIWTEGDDLPRLVTDKAASVWQVPQAALVLVLSDLGALQQQGRSEQDWLRLGRLLQHQHNRLIALLPCQVQAVSPALKRLFSCVSAEIADVASEEQEQAQAELLLTALAPCIRLEPSLLRDMRLNLAGLDERWQSAASVESRVWQHAALAELNSVAASWNSEARKQYLQAFENLSDAEKNVALATIRSWRGALSENIWYEEILSLAPDTQALPVIQADVQQAQQKLAFIVQQGQHELIAPELVAYYRRLEQRMPEACVTQSPALQQMISLLGVKQHLVDPKNHIDAAPKSSALLYQRGTRLFLCAYDPFAKLSAGMSPLASLQMRGESVQVCDAQGRGLGVLSHNSSKGFDLGAHRALQIRSALEVLYLETRQAPEGSEMGRDSYGLYVDLEFFGVVQRFRWIPAGRFMMGSLEDERERVSKTLHEVTLTTGFWMADTACTQALWQAVMGANPANFQESNQQPVEQVSWLDVQDFLNKLSQAHSGLLFALATEAQWEYACRAGTTTPFSFGEMITTEQVNYDGNFPYAGGEKGEYREKTVVVKSLPANSWGLYEMHGNVWEWCVDEWQKDLGSSPVSNPVYVQCLPDFPAASSLKQTGIIALNGLANAGDEAVARVLRGGSWSSDGGLCRSAFRFNGSASSRYCYFGFRFVLGHELQYRSSELTQPQSARRGAAQAEDRSGSGGLRQRLKKGLGLKGNNET